MVINGSGEINGTNGLRRSVFFDKFQHGFSLLFSNGKDNGREAVAIADGDRLGHRRNICEYYSVFECSLGNISDP